MVLPTIASGCLRPAILLAFTLAMVAIPVSAVTLYNNGPVNGYVGGTDLYLGDLDSDSFTLFGDSILTGVAFDVWTPLGDVPHSVQWAIASGDPITGLIILDSGTADLTSTFLFQGAGISSGSDIDLENFELPDISLGSGTYYLVLQNGKGIGLNPIIYWDQNNGPSTAYHGSNLTPSNSFQIEGTPVTTSTPSTTSAPEPGTLSLLGTGLFFLLPLSLRQPHNRKQQKFTVHVRTSG